MAGLPDLSAMICTPGTPVTPEWLNAVPNASLDFQRAWERQHLAFDGEHGEAAPQAAGTITYNGAWIISPGSRNIESVTSAGTGSAVVKLAIAADSPGEWFPVAIPQGAIRARANEAYGGRTSNSCQILLRTNALGTTEDSNISCSFRFEAYMPARAPRQSGNAPEPVLSACVRNRISVDGVSSAEHRNKLLRFCDWLRKAYRDTWHYADGDSSGLHVPRAAPGDIPLGAFLVVFDSDGNPSLAWTRGHIKRVDILDGGNSFAYEVSAGNIRCARWMPALDGWDDPWLSRVRSWRRNEADANTRTHRIATGAGNVPAGSGLRSIGVVVFGR